MAEAQVPKINQEELLKKVDDLEKRLQTKDAEIEVYKMLMAQMEEEVAQSKKIKILQEKQTQDVDGLKAESEKTLTKAKSMIFERTKIIKNQELQIEAFTQQIDSLKDVVRITKDLLQIRNLEVEQLETKISSIEGKQKAEKERYDLMHKKLELMIRHNAELKREYETQLCLFTALRERYSERELAKDVVDNLKNNKAPTTSSTLDTTAVVENPVQPTGETEANTTITPQDNINNIVLVNKAIEAVNINVSPEQKVVKSDDALAITSPVEASSKTAASTTTNPEINDAVDNTNTTPEQISVKIEDPVAIIEPISNAVTNATNETAVKIDSVIPVTGVVPVTESVPITGVDAVTGVVPVIENVVPVTENVVPVTENVVPVTENIVPVTEKVATVTGPAETNLESKTVKIEQTVPVLNGQVEATEGSASTAVNTDKTE